MAIVEDYIAKFESPQKEALERIDSIVKELAPQAKEALSYDMPAYKVGDEYLIWFAAFKNHVSIFPTSDEMVKALGEEVAKHRTSTGTLQFKLNEPLPEELIKNIVNWRLQNLG